jgi:hypothetical protein
VIGSLRLDPVPSLPGFNMDEHAVACRGIRSLTLHDDPTRSMLCALSRSRGPKSLHPTVEGRPMAVGDKVLGAEAHWMMGRVMPRQFLDGIGEYLDLEAPASSECSRSDRKPGPHRFPERSAPIAQRREFAWRRRRELPGSRKQVVW